MKKTPPRTRPDNGRGSDLQAEAKNESGETPQTKGKAAIFMRDRDRVWYVLFNLAPRVDTVALLKVEEVDELIARARTGEFDDDIRMAV